MRRRSLITRVRTFDDALSLARRIYRHLGEAEAVAVVNCAGGVVDTYALCPLVAGDASRLAVIGCAIAGIRPTCLRLILVSSRPRQDAGVLNEPDVDRWHELFALCETSGIHLADWFIIDGAFVRSMALSCSSEVDWSVERGDGEE